MGSLGQLHFPSVKTTTMSSRASVATRDLSRYGIYYQREAPTHGGSVGLFGLWSMLPEVETTSANGRFFRSSFYFDYTFAINHFGIDYFKEDKT
jgi:hypothetical protein